MDGEGILSRYRQITVIEMDNTAMVRCLMSMPVFMSKGLLTMTKSLAAQWIYPDS
jgi:hypothetical protein